MYLYKRYKEIPYQAKAAFWFLVCSFLQKGITMITTPIFTRLLTTEEYGMFSVFNSWYTILFSFLTLSLCYGVFSQAVIKFENDRNDYIVSMQGLNLFLIIFWGIIYFVGKDFWNEQFRLTTIQMVSLFVMCWSTASFTFWTVDQRTEYKYIKLVIVTLIFSLSKPILGIILVIGSTDKVTARIVGLAIVEVVVAIYCFITHYKKSNKIINLKYWKYALIFSIPLVPHYLSQNVLSNSDRIMIERMDNADNAGIYSIAYSASMIMVVFNQALGMTVSPWMFRKIKNKQYQEIAPIAYLSLSFIAAVNIALIALAPEIVKIFAPNEYYEARWAIPPVAMSSYYIFMYDYFSRFEFYYEKTVKIMLASIGGAVLNIILNYICIPKWGYIAAAYTTLICYIIYVITHYLFMKSICKEQNITERIYDIKKIVFLSVVFMITGFCLMITYDYVYIRYLLIIIMFIVAYVNRNAIINIIKSFLALKKNSQ